MIVVVSTVENVVQVGVLYTTRFPLATRMEKDGEIFIGGWIYIYIYVYIHTSSKIDIAPSK